MDLSIIVHDENHEPMMVNEADMDFRIPGLPHSVVKTRKGPAFDSWFRKLRTTQIDMLFKKIYNRINHLIFSVQNQNKWFGMLGTSNYVNYSRRNPKRSAKYVYHTGTFATSTSRAGTSCTKKEVEPARTFFQFWSTSSRKDDFTDIDLVKSRATRNTIRPTKLKQKCKKKYFQGIHDRLTRDPEFRRRMIENNRDEELCRKWDALADEDHTHHLTHMNTLHKSNWWLHSNNQCRILKYLMRGPLQHWTTSSIIPTSKEESVSLE